MSPHGTEPEPSANRALFSFQIGDKNFVTESRPIFISSSKTVEDSHVLEALCTHLARFEEEQTAMEKADAQMMAEFSREQGLENTFPMIPHHGFPAPPAPAEPTYGMPAFAGWTRVLMSRPLFQAVFEPYLNDLLAEKLEQTQRQDDPRPVRLSREEKCRLALTALRYTIGFLARRLLTRALARSNR